MSTDNTVELLLKDSRVEVRYFNSGNQIRDDLYLEIKNHAWKDSRGIADWVIVCDFDEIFQRAISGNFDLDFTWPYGNEFTVIRSHGYNMNSLDAPLYAEGHPFLYSQRGTYHDPEEKMCCFRPDQIKEINYIPGCHGAKPTGNVRVLYDKNYKLLHFKFWNIDLYLQKMAEYQQRLSVYNRKVGAGYQYLESLERHRELFLNGVKISQYLFDIERDNSKGPNLYYE